MTKALCGLTLCLLAPAVSAVDVENYGLFEKSFTASGSYTNPYTEVSATASFSRPGGGTWNIPLFWDGGDTWKVRLSPDAQGTWSYSISSGDAGLNGQSGSFNCVASGNKGGIEQMAGFPYHLQYQDGTPFWWFGDTNWSAFGYDSGDNLNHNTVLHYIDVRASQGFNYIHTNTPSTGSNEGGQFFDSMSQETLNPGFFQEMDSRLQYMNSKGITSGVMLAWANGSPAWDDFPSDNARLRYTRYMAARYSALNVVFIVSGEWNETGTKAMYQAIGNEIAGNDPHGRMIAIHSTGSVEEFASDAWMSFGDYQQIYSSLHSRILQARDHNKPVVNSEYAYFLRDKNGDGTVDKPNSATLEEFRHASWDIVMAGGYLVSGFGTTYFGGYRDPGPFNVGDPRNDPAEEDLQHMKDFFNGLQWWRLQPNDGLLSGSGTLYCLAETGRDYVAYGRGNSGTNSLSLGGAAAATYSIQRFDPRTGSWSDEGSYSGAGPVTLDPPDNQDWVFVVSSTGGANLPPSVSISAQGETTVLAGSGVTFDVTASDADGSIDSHVWHWGPDDESGAGAPASSVIHTFPSTGDFDVYLTVTDDDGESADSNHVTIHVVDNLPPVIDSASATPNTAIAGQTVSFECTAHDPEGDPLTYRWDFEGDGAFDATGQNASHVYDTAGHFDPVVEVSDGSSATTQQLTVDVEPDTATLEFEAEADTYIYVSNPATNYGDGTTLGLGGPSAERVIFLRFNVSGLPSNVTVTSAEIRMCATNSSTDPEGGGAIRLYSPSNPTWDEMQPTWNDPLAGSDASGDLDTIGPISAGETYLYQNLASVVITDGLYTFVIRSQAADGAAFHSSESASSADRPKLLITYDDGGGTDTTAPTVYVDSAVLRGTANDNSGNDPQVTVGGAAVGVSSGQWVSGETSLPSGTTDIPVVAEDPSGNSSSISVSVVR